MKHFILCVGMVFIGSTGLTQAAPPASTTAMAPQVHQINMRLRTQWKLIMAGIKAGKITQAQAAGLRGDLKSIRRQEMAFLKQDGNHNLTAGQRNQLNQSLDKNSAALGETPVN